MHTRCILGTILHSLVVGMSDDATSKRRRRVSRACIICRKKKIKCDGQEPCLSCVAGGKACEYDGLKRAERKRRKPKNDNIRRLTARLDRLESLLGRLAGASDADGARGADGAAAADSESEGHAGSHASAALSSESEPDAADAAGASADAAANGAGCAKVRHSPKEYFGAHSLVGIFSEKSVEWLAGKLPAAHLRLLLPIRNFPIIIDRWIYHFRRQWTDPHVPGPRELHELKRGSFPARELVADLLDHVYPHIYMANFLCDVETARALFAVHYDAALPAAAAPKRRRLTISELLLMNVVLTLCALVAFDREVAGHEAATLALLALSRNELVLLRKQCFRNAIFYYSRVLTFSEGIQTVQAILMFAIYIEMSSLFPDVSYVMVLVAVRLAQALGLHRFESFRSDPADVAALKRKVWWFCQYLDMEICYRQGKPPLVNALDVSTLTAADTALPFTCHLASGNLQNYTGGVLIHLAWIRARTYHRLFSATAQNYTVAELVHTLRQFNSQMAALERSIDAPVRPRFYNDAEFGAVPYEHLFETDCGRNGPENLLTVQLTYFLHLMTINRIPFVIEHGATEPSSEFMPFRNLALNLARTILIICNRLRPATTPVLFVRWLLFVPFAAFLVLLGNLINRLAASPELAADIDLLGSVLMRFLSRHDLRVDAHHDETRLRDIAVDLLTRSMLSILILVVELRTALRVLDNNAALKAHLDRCQEVFPDLYRGNGVPFGVLFDEFKLSTSPSSLEDGVAAAAAAAPATAAAAAAAAACYQGTPAFARHPSPPGPYQYSVPSFSLLGSLPTRTDTPVNYAVAPAPAPFAEPYSGFAADYDVDVAFSSMMNTMPNVFFDNNLGT